jgi:chaperone modulatory protein CbpM
MTYGEDDVIARIDRLSRRDLQVWMRNGWVRPAREGATGPLFDDLDVARLRLICDLRMEMSLHSETVPMILSLIDQVHGLRGVLRTLTEAVERQPESVRRDIAAACRPGGGGVARWRVVGPGRD